MEQLSPIESLLKEIDKCNQELKRLEVNPDEANREVNSPSWFGSDQFKITYKNQIELDRDGYCDQLRWHLKPYNLGLRFNAYPAHKEHDGLKYLAFIDILGFSDIVQKNSHEELGRIVSLLTRDIQMYLVAKDVGKTKSRLYSYGFAPDMSEVKINSILLSDTIIFWSNDDSVESFLELVRIIQNLMHFEAYYINIGLRGAITRGEFSYNDLRISHSKLVVDQSSIYGKAIVEAYLLEKNQEWMGCIVSKDAIDHFISQKPSEDNLDVIFNKYLIEYVVPYKEVRTPITYVTKLWKSLFGRSTAKKEHVIKWPRAWKSENGEEAIKRCFTRYQKLNEIPHRPDVQRKYINTKKFTDYVIRISPQS